MGLVLRNQIDSSEAENIQLSSGTAATAGTTNVDEAIAQIINDVNNIQIGSGSLPVEVEQNASFIISNVALYPVDCTGASVTASPPSNPVPGDKFAIVDSRGSCSINNIFVDFISTGKNLHGGSRNYSFNQDGAYTLFEYINNTIGWIAEQ